MICLENFRDIDNNPRGNQLVRALQLGLGRKVLNLVPHERPRDSLGSSGLYKIDKDGGLDAQLPLDPTLNCRTNAALGRDILTASTPVPKPHPIEVCNRANSKLIP